jgi:hypothetical protein
MVSSPSKVCSPHATLTGPDEPFSFKITMSSLSTLHPGSSGESRR